jgi:hypothetical protein
MKKTNKPVPKAPARKAPVTKQSAAKPKPKKAQGQAELLPIVERLAQAAERLAQAAERLTEATIGSPAARAYEATTRQNPAPDSVL